MSEGPTIIYVVRGYPVRTREDFERAKQDMEPFRTAGELALKALRRMRHV